MTADRALQLLAALGASGVDCRVDGGWGVDALLGEQTRPHDDLDLVVALDDFSAIEEVLAPEGFAVSEDHRPIRFVMRNTDGEQLDFHTVTYDEAGGGVQPQPKGGTFRYPHEGFVAGKIGGFDVVCISAQVQVLCHLGYDPSPKDVQDVLALCGRFDLDVPEPYRAFVSASDPALPAILEGVPEPIRSSSSSGTPMDSRKRLSMLK